MAVTTIDDAHDPRLADYVELASPSRRMAIESDEFFITEGLTAIGRLLRSRFPVRSMLLIANAYERLSDELAGAEFPIYVASREVLREAVGFNLHRGAVASARRLERAGPRRRAQQQSHRGHLGGAQ